MTFLRFLNPLLMIVLGLGAGLALAGKRQDGWRLYAAGAWTFLLSQALHIPFNALALNPWLGGFAPQGGGLLVIAAALGLSAGVFEETARWAVYRFSIRDARSWHAALSFGAGHGGIEAILLGALTLYSVLQLVVLRGEGAGRLLAQVDDLAAVRSQVEAFWALPWYAVLLGALERLFAICFHLSASVMVLQVFLRRQKGWLVLAILWHALLDAAAVFVMVRWGMYWAEAALAAAALISLGIIRRLRSEEASAAGPPYQPELDLKKVEVTSEQIDASRFT